MHGNILTNEQQKLEPLVQSFASIFGLVGGTAIALQLGHRRSIDFDLFTHKEFDNRNIRRKIVSKQYRPHVLRDERGQYTLRINGVFFTFFQYDYRISYRRRWGNSIRLPDVLTLAAMKAHALGRRAKWKDYVDLYFILQTKHTMQQIVTRAKSIFKNEFNERFFRQQLSYFDDVNYAESVEYMPGFEVADGVVKKYLIEQSVQ